MKRISELWVLGTLVIGASACDPCAGTSSCRTSARVALSGHIVEHATGHPVSGAEFTFVRTSGVDLVQDTVHGVSDADGFFTIAASAKGSGDVAGTLHVTPPGRPAYDIAGVQARTTTVAGDGTDIGRIVSDPYILYIADIRDRVKGTGAGANASVTFTRTGGVEISPSVIKTNADASGQFYLAPAVTQPGTVFGDLTISAKGYPHPFTVSLAIPTEYHAGPTHLVHVANIGSALLWVGQIYRRGSNEPVAGVPVDFVRTGGIQITPDHFSTVTGTFGLFPIRPTPLAEGELIGDITVHPPKLPPFTVHGVRVRTEGDDSVRLAGKWGYGSQAYGLMELRYRTTNTIVANGTSGVFRRTGGLPMFPDTASYVVKELGFAALQTMTDTDGTVLADVEVRLGEPYGTEIIHNVPIKSAAADTEFFIGTYIVGRWFPQVGQLVDSVNHKPIPGAKVMLTHVSGVQFTPDPFITTPDSNGYFQLRPQPLADGDAVADMTFVFPAPYAPVTVKGIHLRTSMDDTVRFAGAWFIQPHVGGN